MSRNHLSMICFAVLVACGGGDPEPDPNNMSANNDAANQQNANNSDNNDTANNGGRTNEQGCYAAESCNDDVEGACRRFVDNYYACVELAYADDPERIQREKEMHEDDCDPFVGLFHDDGAETFHCQADAFGAADCSTTEGFNTVVSQSSGC